MRKNLARGLPCRAQCAVLTRVSFNAFNFGALEMKAKRRSPAMGPLVTFALMIGSAGLIATAAHYLDSHQKTTEQTVAASSSDASHSNANTRQ
jgi:hypothetical protein